ncbi:MAG: hypothetical protein K2J73_06835 [Oscillospiraceae bacterium]|nr:hypothetical protein [Oscillospiraceae bacterium]
MNKIKMSFTKVLPFMFIFYIVLMAMSNITNQFSRMIITNAESPAWNGIAAFFNLVIAVAVSPLYIGFYRFCFERVNGRKPHILSVFDFYRSAAGFAKSAAAYLISVAAIRVSASAFPYLIMFSIFASRDENTGALFAAAIIALVILVLSELFFLMPYAYAENSSDGLAAAIKRSIKRGFKFMIVLVLLYLADILASQLILTFYREDIYNEVLAGKAFVSIAGFFDFDLILTLILHSIMLWIKFTAAYMILGVSPKEQNVAAENAYSETDEDTENDEEKPFIEPYDFCIEADERFHDEKIIETEDIRGVDILTTLEEMDLAFDVVNHFGIRRKLKKMFDDLAFEIGEFVTYQGGRSIENSFTEEIDEREFEVSVEISKASDCEPFKMTLSVNISDNEEE